MGVSLLEKQNWYDGDYQAKIPITCWQGWWTGGDLKEFP